MPSFQRPQTVATGVYQHLRQQLLDGALAPGAWLREQELAETLNVSRTPVREAVRLLAQEGLVVLEPNRGVRVPQLDLAEAIATYEVRERLEAMAAELAARHATASDHTLLRQQLQNMRAIAPTAFAEHIAADNALHALIAKAASNPVLEEVIERLNHRVQRVKVITRHVNTSSEAHRQHELIVEAVVAGQAEAAGRAMAHHIRSNLEVVKQRLGEQQDLLTRAQANHG